MQSADNVSPSPRGSQVGSPHCVVRLVGRRKGVGEVRCPLLASSGGVQAGHSKLCMTSQGNLSPVTAQRVGSTRETQCQAGVVGKGAASFAGSRGRQTAPSCRLSQGPAKPETQLPTFSPLKLSPRGSPAPRFSSCLLDFSVSAPIDPAHSCGAP